MTLGRLVSLAALALPLASLPSCAATDDTEAPESVDVQDDGITLAKKKERAKHIEAVGAGRGLYNPILLGGIANAETQLAHCWTELTWACKGLPSADCDGGPVVAGAGDGPCSWKQGGLGMFQFDAGTFADTIDREGEKILTVDGNIDAAVDFVIDMVIKSKYVSGVETADDALDWMNSVVVGGAGWDAWIRSVTHYYNGCSPSGCSIFWDRYDHYDQSARDLLAELGPGFFTVTPDSPAPAPVTGEVAPAELYWARQANGSYAFRALPWVNAAKVEYRVEGYLIGTAAADDPTTAEVEDNFPLSYTFNVQKAERFIEALAFDGDGALVARGIGLIDSVPGTAVYIRQMGDAVYEVGLERPSSQVATMELRADTYLITDSVTGKTKSPRLAVRNKYNLLGKRNFKLTTYDSTGKVRGNLYRTFTLE